MARRVPVDATIEHRLARFAARMRRLREERGQTLDELAATSSLSKTYLSRIESAERQPSLAAVFSLARAWDLPVSALFDEGPNPEVTSVERHAAVEWNGDAEGDGYIRVGSGNVEGAYSQEMRRAGQGINPEELIGAAQAGCFTMTLVRLLSEGGHRPKHVDTDATVHGQESPDGFRITRVDLFTDVSVPGLSEAALRDYAQMARRTCTVSRALTGVEIALHTSLA